MGEVHITNPNNIIVSAYTVGFANKADTGRMIDSKPEAKRVMRVFVHPDATILVLHLDTGESISTTPGHPFAVEGKGFVLAGKLAIGTSIVTRAGPAVTVIGIDYAPQRATVYNFEVEGDHSYFVGLSGSGLWVHNQSQRELPFDDLHDPVPNPDLQARADALHGRLKRIGYKMQATAVLEVRSPNGTLFNVVGSNE